jgi:hypothetical protein
VLTRRAREEERARGARARKTGTDRAAPLGRGRGGRGAHEEKPPLIAEAHLSGGAGAREAPLGWTGPVWAKMILSFSRNF